MTLSSTSIPRLAIALATVAGLAVGPASAGGFGLDTFGASATGQSNAGAASGSGGLSSMFWNPAAVTMRPGWNAQVDATVLDLSAHVTPTAGTSPFLGDRASGDLGIAALIPSGFVSYQVNDRVWIGLSAVVPFGATTKPESDWAGQVYSRTSRIRSYSFNPVIGYKVNEWLSLAAGPNIEVFQVRLNRATSFLPGADTGSLRVDDVAIGFTAGALITPREGTAIGIGYRSSVSHDLRGRLNTGDAVIPVKARLDTPDRLSFGLTQALAPDVRLNLGYEWSNWSRLGTIPYVGPGGVVVTSLPLNYRDGHLFSVGAEYDVTTAWTVRGGLGYEISPVTEAVRSAAIPDSNRVLLSVGASYRYNERISLDFAYQHAFLGNSRIRIGSGSQQLVTANLPVLGATDLPFNADVRGSADVFSVALNYRFQ